MDADIILWYKNGKHIILWHLDDDIKEKELASIVTPEISIAYMYPVGREGNLDNDNQEWRMQQWK